SANTSRPLDVKTAGLFELDSSRPTIHPTFPIRPIINIVEAVQRPSKEAQHMVSERAERTPRRSAAAFSVVLSAVVLTAVMGVAVGGAATKPTPPIAASSSLCKGKTFKIGYDVFSSTQP